MRPIGEVINEALAHHRAGRLDEAAGIYQRLVEAGAPHPATYIARLGLSDIAFARAHGRLRSDKAEPDRPLALYYRISSSSRARGRIADKQRCLMNFLAVFTPRPGELVVIADNCDQPTLDMLASSLAAKGVQAEIRQTSLGNAASWRHALDLALARRQGWPIYFVEDDFLHRAGARQALAEGLALADYVSLYDHPDKYGPVKAANPIVSGIGEVALVVRTASSHWKTTTSATMTFATTPAVIGADRDIWDQFSDGVTPYDFQAFVSLVAGRRSLIVPMPAFATHGEAEFLAPGVDWSVVPG